MRMKFPKRYVIVLLTFICTNVCYIERVGFSIAYTVVADANGVNQANKGMILSMFYYGYVISQIPGGWAAQRIGGRRVLLMSFVLWSLICGLIPLDPNRVTILVLSRLFVGVSQGFIFPAIHTVLAQWVPPQERSRSVSLTTSGMYLGAACGMLFFPSLVKHMGPQSVFFVEAVLGVAWSIIWLKFSSDPPRMDLPKMAMPKVASRDMIKAQAGGVVAPRTVKIPWLRIIFSLPVWAIVVNNFTFHYALYVLMNWLPTYFELGLQRSLQDMGSSKMLPYFNMFIFSNIGGVVADHLITRRILSVTNTRKVLNTVGRPLLPPPLSPLLPPLLLTPLLLATPPRVFVASTRIASLDSRRRVGRCGRRCICLHSQRQVQSPPPLLFSLILSPISCSSPLSLPSAVPRSPPLPHAAAAGGRLDPAAAGPRGDGRWAAQSRWRSCRRQAGRESCVAACGADGGPRSRPSRTPTPSRDPTAVMPAAVGTYGRGSRSRCFCSLRPRSTGAALAAGLRGRQRRGLGCVRLARQPQPGCEICGPPRRS